ncbi:MAG: hypothetical protein QNK36_15120 [Colwellia sp.]|nr:hypothetical protein [Colwellia sp.]
MSEIITSEQVDLADAIAELETLNPELHAMLTKKCTPDVIKFKNKGDTMDFSVFEVVEAPE